MQRQRHQPTALPVHRRAANAFVRGLLAAVALLATPALLPPLAHAQTAPLSSLGNELRDWLLHGQLDAALRRLDEVAAQRHADRGSKTTGIATLPWPANEAALVAEVLLARGRLADAEQVLGPHVQPGKLKTAPLPVLLQEAERLRRTGPAEARKRFLMAAAAAQPMSLPLRVLVGEQLRELGKRVEAHRLLDGAVTAYEDKQADGALDLLAVAKALALTGYPKDALQVIEQASEVGADPSEGVLVQLQEGELFLSKYNYRDADSAFKHVLEENPHHPRALLGMARIDLASDHDIAKAKKRVEAVLQGDPQLLDALALRAEIALWDEDLQAAGEYLARAAKLRPDWLPGLRLQGTLALLRDDNAAWQRMEAQYKKLAPGDGELHLTAAVYLEINHRYTEVVELLQTAVQLDSELWQAHAALGMALARMADDKGAERALVTAFDGDAFDVRTANQLSILYDGVLKQMVLLKGRLVDLRVHKKERPALERTVLPFLQEAVQKLNDAYGFEAKRPLQIEIFPDTEQFSVRTVGLPQLGAHAVCFGHLITSRSPVTEPFNWQLVLTHELAHVYHIQSTGGRVPRWLTEGLAMMETAWANPRWVQQNDRRAWDRLQGGRLARLATFNLAFSQARSMQDILDAYDQAMRTVQFLAERFGRDKVRQLVSAHRSGKPTVQLLQDVLGASAKELDEAFATWLAKDLARFSKDFRPDWRQLARQLGLPEPSPDTETMPDFTLPADASPIRKALIQGLLSWRAGKADSAVQHFASGIALPVSGGDDALDLCRLRSGLLDLAVAAADRAKAKEHAEWLVSQEGGRCDGVEQRQVLAALAKKAGDKAKTIEHLQRGLAIDPEDDALGGLQTELLAQAGAALRDEPGDDAKGWLAVLAPGGWPVWRSAVRARIDADSSGAKAAAALSDVAWAQWHKQPELAEAKADLAYAASVLEAVDPAGRRAVQAEARAHAAAARHADAIVAWRLAAERSKTPAERAEAWCAAADTAAAAKAKSDTPERREEAAELQRRCEAERPAPPRTTAPKPTGGAVPAGGM